LRITVGYYLPRLFSANRRHRTSPVLLQIKFEIYITLGWICQHPFLPSCHD